jgi:protocatechuate 3,4-dioxygenase beta subunit
LRTDHSGRYAFETVIPGRYAQGNPPPRHIHLAVSHPRARSLVTELVFAGDPGVAPNDPLAVTPAKAAGAARIAFTIVLRSR